MFVDIDNIQCGIPMKTTVRTIADFQYGNRQPFKNPKRRKEKEKIGTRNSYVVCSLPLFLFIFDGQYFDIFDSCSCCVVSVDLPLDMCICVNCL